MPQISAVLIIGPKFSKMSNSPSIQLVRIRRKQEIRGKLLQRHVRNPGVICHDTVRPPGTDPLRRKEAIEHANQ